MEAIAGILLVARSRRLWALAFGPLLGALGIYVALGIAGAIWLAPRVGRAVLERAWPAAADGGGAGVAGAAGSFLFLLVWLLLFSYFFVLVAGLFSGLVWDRLSLAVEEMEGGAPPAAAALGCATLTLDTSARLLFNGAVGLAGLLLSFALGPPAGVVAAAVVGLLDFTSPAYLRRGHLFGSQLARLFRRPDGRTLAFALVAGLLSLVPLIGVLLMPGLVAGGTLLVRRREAARGA